MPFENIELESLEKDYLDRIYFAMSSEQKPMLDYLTSRDKIEGDWEDHFWRSDKRRQTSDLARGAERVFFYLVPNEWIPNSTPIGSDLFFEAHNAYVHIEIKTARETNTADYKGKVPIGHNQSSYKPTSSYRGEPIDTTPHLPEYYSDGKPCLTYAIQIIYDHSNLDTIVVLLICIPNGQLFDAYENDIITCGKTKGESFRYKYSRNPHFMLLEDRPFRLKVLYFNKDYPNFITFSFICESKPSAAFF